MKLRWLLLPTNILPAAIGAAAGTLGHYWGGTPGLWAAVAVAVVASGATAWWLGRRLRRGLHVLEQVVESGGFDRRQGAEFREFNELAAKLAAYCERSAKALGHARQQSCEISGLLTQMNRRSAAAPVTGEQSAAAGQLRRLLASLAKTVEADLLQVSNCSHDIARRTQEIGGGVEEQTNAVSQTTTFVEQMSANIDSVSQNADAAHKAAVAARESAAAGLALVQELIRGMDRIRLHVAAGAKKLRALGDRSHEIGSIVEMIGSISERTDLLALNASIESVRAGEHGRGFAVVAEEVRKLAEQTAQATREVSGLIESIQIESHESIAAMADEQSQVEAEARRVNDAGTALERISQTSSDSAQRVGEISGATLHQLRVTQKVVSAMQRISEIARGIRLQTDGVCATTNGLTKVANQLGNSLAPLRECKSTPNLPESARAIEDDSAAKGMGHEAVSRADDMVATTSSFSRRSADTAGGLVLVGSGTEIGAP